MKYLKLFEAKKQLKLGEYTNSISFQITGVKDSSMKAVCKCIDSKDGKIKLRCYILDPRQYGKLRKVGAFNPRAMGLTFEPATQEEIKLFNTLDKANQFDL